ncbi:MAG: radical SAM protein [bacterium]|jgi:radical SAM superfamily enzyme YgiQ (UPF0313 family)
MHVALGVRRLRFSIPLGPAYLAAVLEREGHRVSLFEFGSSEKRWLGALSADPPGLAAYSVLTGEQNDCLRFHRKLKRLVHVPSILGGPHPTFFPGILLEEGVDAICIGEAEEAFAEFVAAFAGSGKIPEQVRNVHVRNAGGETVSNPVRPLVRDLDTLPFPNRKLFTDADPVLSLHPVRHFIAQRGCPHDCTFCFNQGYHRIYGKESRRIRSRDPEAVCAEVDAVRREFPLGMAAFVDDSFAQDPGWLERFCSVYSRRLRFPFSCNLRPDPVVPRVAPMLADAGCRLAYVGIESGAATSRKRLGRGMREGTIRASMDALHKHGIRTITENMVGIPGERFEDALSTLRLNAALSPTLANCSIFAPYPGLPLTDLAIRAGSFDGDFGKLEGNFYRTTALEFRSGAERNRIVNLRAFFSILARRPGMLPLLSPLLSLPPNRLFEVAGTVADGWFLRKCLPYRQPAGATARLLCAYLRLYRS